MEPTKETNPFRDFLDAVTVVEYTEVRRKIITRCKINEKIFRNWKNGITAVPELAKPIINQIAKDTQTYNGCVVFTIEDDEV